MATSKYPNEIKINPNQGGKAAIECLIEAYGFTTRQALADHLDVSKSTLAKRYMRDTFPADWIILYALETGISLSWLASGIGSKNSELNDDISSISHKKSLKVSYTMKITTLSIRYYFLKTTVIFLVYLMLTKFILTNQNVAS
ncbi:MULTISPECIES: helix-turn-helix transcriptional regulator [Enterobacter]|uniref:helix-turn-helix transcriptional regulator n=1 Tax=Enterobacter TaxID=547 RepID=UPI001D02D0AD|nr:MULTISPECIES: helix-turn-helix transcriptional regulator [Enterobacter]MCK6733691.1 helix-turn-helix domain containing protein [Enterobacter bugandensis]MCM7428893.1 helix-turn-helix domain containing protein [Enterobacter bugandensis]